MAFEILTARWDQLIRRVTAGIGPGSRLTESLTELFPTLDVENVPGELLILGQTDICTGGASHTAAAAMFPAVQIFNPVDSGKLVTVSSCTFSANTLMDVHGAFFPVGGAGTRQNSERFRDLRRGPLLQPTAQIRTRDIGALQLQDFLYRPILNENITIQDANTVCVLPPGQGFEITGTVATSKITATFLWRERSAVQAELQF